MSHLRSAGLLATVAVLVFAGFVAAPASAQATSCLPPNPGLATAKAATTPLRITLSGMVIFDAPGASSSQKGPGVARQTGPVAFTTPSDLPFVQAQILSSFANSSVTTDGNAAADASTTVAHLNVLSGMVTADVLKASSITTARGDGATTNSLASTVVRMQVNGQWVTQTEPSADIPLPAQFGPGSFVRTHVRTDRSRLPTPADPFFQGELEVNMIWVHVTDAFPVVAGDQTLDVMVARAWTQSRAPVICKPLQQSVRADAYTAQLFPTGWGGPFYQIGGQSVGPTGGVGGQSLVQQDLQAGGAHLHVDTLKTTVNGTVKPSVSSVAKATSTAQGLCLDLNGVHCFIQGTALYTEANAVGNPWAAYEWGKTTFVNVKINGVDVCAALGLQSTCSPPPNTKMDNLVPGFHITLNEQWGDQPIQPGQAGLTVRAIHYEWQNGRSGAPGNGFIVGSHAFAQYKMS
jgi:hypothetical protein